MLFGPEYKNTVFVMMKLIQYFLSFSNQCVTSLGSINNFSAIAFLIKCTI